MNNCKTCFYYINKECHRNPPTNVIKSYLYDPSAVVMSELKAALEKDYNVCVASHSPELHNALLPIYYQGWPKVKEDDYCGEYSLKALDTKGE